MDEAHPSELEGAGELRVRSEKQSGRARGALRGQSIVLYQQNPRAHRPKRFLFDIPQTSILLFANPYGPNGKSARFGDK
jgi:hypothetical protein